MDMVASMLRYRPTIFHFGLVANEFRRRWHRPLPEQTLVAGAATLMPEGGYYEN